MVKRTGTGLSEPLPVGGGGCFFLLAEPGAPFS